MISEIICQLQLLLIGLSRNLIFQRNKYMITVSETVPSHFIYRYVSLYFLMEEKCGQQFKLGLLALAVSVDVFGVGKRNLNF